MASGEINLSGSNIGGNFTGGDNYSTNITNKYESSEYIKTLYQKFDAEKSQDQQLRDLCEELDYLNTQKQNEKVIGLENKLHAAGKPNWFIDYATELKERFNKKLHVNTQFSAVAQDINVHILTKVRLIFTTEIYPMICNNVPEDKIMMLINERIVAPIRSELGINLFKYTDEDIMGMVFFLTGNCHIKWCA